MQIIFSKITQPFVKKCIALARSILEDEVKIIFRGNRFFYGGYYYSLHFVAFEGGKKLGYFDASIMEIGIAKSLAFADNKLLEDILKHEIAHLLCFLKHGNLELPHGEEFKNICKKYNWERSIAAFIPEKEVEERSKRLTDKIIKLFDLSTSNNVHEAKAALAKARSLMLAHGIDNLEEDDDLVVMRVIEEKRTSQKLRAISEILRSFFVYPVINCGRGKVYLEIFGERSNVEIGEYLAHMLDTKFDELWEKESGFSGVRAKSSFFQGIAQGFLREIHTKDQEPGIIRVEKILRENIRIAYPRLSKSTSTRSIDLSALKKGERIGSELKLPKGIKKSKLFGFLPLHKG